MRRESKSRGHSAKNYFDRVRVKDVFMQKAKTGWSPYYQFSHTLAFVVALLCALRSSHGNVGELFGALLVNGFICALLPYAIAGYRKTRSQHIYQWQLFTTVVVGSIIVIGTSFFST
jgi:xanthine/uracil permease